MTVSNASSRVSYQEDGITTVFPVPFRFLSNAELVVQRLLPDGSIEDLALGADYAVAGANNPSGGSVTRLAATAGAELAIARATDRIQQLQLTSGDKFPAKSVENALDRHTMNIQEVDEKADDVAARAPLLLQAAAARDDLIGMTPVVTADGGFEFKPVNGASAYDVWLSLGNTGTEADFIASLQGQDATARTGQFVA